MGQVLYADELVRITEDFICFERYYFPFGSKCVELSAVTHVDVVKPSLSAGKWRIHGSGDFRTWFPFDAHRASRDWIFILHLRNKWRRIGFTATDSDAVRKILLNKDLLVEEK